MKQTELKRTHRAWARSPESIAWAQAAKTRRCAVCNRQAHSGHHIVYAQHLRRDGYEHLLYDLRNHLPICAPCHARHHSAFARIPREVLPAEALAFAREVQRDQWLELEYA